MSAIKNFKNKLPTRKRKKEFIVMIFVGLIFFSIIYAYTYIINSPIYSSEYPSINIRCNDDPNYDDYIDCSFELASNDESYNIPTLNSKIKIRGTGGGWNKFSPKKGYRLVLNQPKSLLGMRRDDDWLLLAMYSDYPRMRIKLSYELWRSLEPTNPTAILPESEYVKLFINGEFQGLYLLAERNDRRLFNLDDPKESIDSSLIFQAKGHIFFKEYIPDLWTQDWPNEYEGFYIMDEILSELISYVNNTPDEEFFDPEFGIYSKFDKLNLIDFFIFNFFILHGDFWDKNYFLVRNTYPNKFYLIPWDFDNSFGQMAWNTFDSDKNQESEIFERNYLYCRLLGNEEFKSATNARWLSLRQSIWSDESILEMLADIYTEIKNILEVEVEMWNPGDMRDHWENDIEVSVERLFEWIPERLEFCDDYFERF